MTQTEQLSFFVPGVPVGQGSKTYVPTARGPRARESSEARLKPWRASIVERAPDLAQPLDGPLGIDVHFCFPRPRSHFRSGRFSDQLRDDAPTWHVSKPDSDKLQRAIGDALAGVVVRSDALIAQWRVWKTYSSRPGATIVVFSLLETNEEGD